MRGFRGLTSLVNTSPAELYHALWWYSGAIPNGSSQSSAGSFFLAKGAVGGAGNTSGSATHLFTLSSNLSASTKYAFEGYLLNNSGGYTAYAGLWDVTSGSLVSGSQISSTATTATVTRSSQFTLTPGHTYAVTVWGSTGTTGAFVGDASLVEFPTQQGFGQLSTTSLVETQIPLWVYSSGTASSSATSASSSTLLQKGSTSTGSSSSSATKLHTLNSNWSSNQKFALEASLANGPYTANAELWDITTNTAISSSQVSTTASSATLVRSGSFTLTPGHSYGVAVWQSGGGITYVNKAHLVPLFT